MDTGFIMHLNHNFFPIQIRILISGDCLPSYTHRDRNHPLRVAHARLVVASRITTRVITSLRPKPAVVVVEKLPEQWFPVRVRRIFVPARQAGRQAEAAFVNTTVI